MKYQDITQNYFQNEISQSKSVRKGKFEAPEYRPFKFID